MSHVDQGSAGLMSHMDQGSAGFTSHVGRRFAGLTSHVGRGSGGLMSHVGWGLLGRHLMWILPTSFSFTFSGLCLVTAVFYCLRKL